MRGVCKRVPGQVQSGKKVLEASMNPAANQPFSSFDECGKRSSFLNKSAGQNFLNMILNAVGLNFVRLMAIKFSNYKNYRFKAGILVACELKGS